MLEEQGNQMVHLLEPWDMELEGLLNGEHRELKGHSLKELKDHIQMERRGRTLMVQKEEVHNHLMREDSHNLLALEVRAQTLHMVLEEQD